MGGRTSQTNTSSQTTSMPEEQQTNVNMLLAGARDLFASGGPKYFQGPTVAGPNATQQQGRQGMLDYSGGTGLDFIRGLQNGEQTFLNPNNIFNPSNIPGYAQARQGVMTDATNNLQRNILPAIRSGAVAEGAYGGSRQGIAEGLAAGETARGVGDTLARMDMDAYGKGLDMYNSAAGRAPTTYGLGLMPSQTQQQVGSMYQNDQQRQIDADMQRWNFEQMAPLLNLLNFRDLTGTMGQYGGTVEGTQTQTTSGGSGLMQGLGTALSLASMFIPGGQTLAPLLAGATQAGGAQQNGMGGTWA